MVLSTEQNAEVHPSLPGCWQTILLTHYLQQRVQRSGSSDAHPAARQGRVATWPPWLRPPAPPTTPSPALGPLRSDPLTPCVPRNIPTPQEVFPKPQLSGAPLLLRPDRHQSAPGCRPPLEPRVPLRPLTPPSPLRQRPPTHTNHTATDACSVSRHRRKGPFIPCRPPWQLLPPSATPTTCKRPPHTLD